MKIARIAQKANEPVNDCNWRKVTLHFDKMVLICCKISLILQSHTGVDFGLHETSNYGTTIDNYGTLEVSGDGIMADLLRVRPSSRGGFDFVAVTEVTPLGESSE